MEERFRTKYTWAMSHHLTRRELGLAGANAALGPACAATADSTYQGALDGFEDRVEATAFDPVVWAQSGYEHAPLRMTFRASERQTAERWQRELRVKVTELIGGIPSRETPLHSQTLEVRDFANYRREKFVFESRPGLAVLGYLLTPLDTAAPHRTMICLPGHGRGVDDIVGIDDRGRDRTDKDGYQHDFAIQCVEEGMAAVAIEQVGFGCRRDLQAKAKGLSTSSCQPVAGAALLLGETMIAWRVYDVMRTIDWIEMRDDLDSDRVRLHGHLGRRDDHDIRSSARSTHQSCTRQGLSQHLPRQYFPHLALY